MENNNHDLGTELEQMSEMKLLEMLHTETSKENPNDNFVLLVLNILEERDNNLVHLNERELAAWKKYQKKVRNRARKLKYYLGRITAIAASLVLIIMLVFVAFPQETKAGSLFDMLSRWTDSLFEFFTPGDDSSLVGYSFTTDNVGLKQLRNTVVEYGGTERVIPMWIPEGNELVYLEVDEITHITTISATFLDGNKYLIAKIDIYDTSEPREFYKNMNDPEEWEMFGHIHYVVENREQWSAAWAQDNTECFITLECSEDVLDKILKSIYVLKEK